MSERLKYLKQMLYVTLAFLQEKEPSKDNIGEALKLIHEMREIITRCMSFQCTDENYEKIADLARELFNTMFPDMQDIFRMKTMGEPEIRENVWIETNRISEMIAELKEIEELKETLNLIEHKVTTIIELEKRPLKQEKPEKIKGMMREIEEDLVKEGVILDNEDKEILALMIEKLMPSQR